MEPGVQSPEWDRGSDGGTTSAASSGVHAESDQRWETDAARFAELAACGGRSRESARSPTIQAEVAVNKNLNPRQFGEQASTDLTVTPEERALMTHEILRTNRFDDPDFDEASAEAAFDSIKDESGSEFGRLYQKVTGRGN